ncbi:hypothetical protein GCM10007938_19820 [Vibrio zhanjiangensis]|uniref:protein O-GlcNAc transferase n=1 Tax=Vibrio zhanjiangensis TaxID=1046128 RepID=A0ABQ6EYY7_9VIBR|nr:glycosyltransferase family 41 protein [Vibrio zhanjiangensis]GLT18204.1 hypothetical protein GCM10007938_19820 [Vibrio zhanjiangensis]
MTTDDPLNETLNKLINLYNRGQLGLVIQEAEALAILHPSHPMVWNILGVASKSTGNIERASQAFRNVLTLCPENVGGYNNMAVVLRDQGKLQEAIEYYDRAIELKPDYAEAFNNKGVALRDLGHLQEALISYQQALAIKPDYAEAHNNLGIIFQEQGQLKPAYECYTKALSLQPNYIEAYDNMGALLEQQSKPELAIMAYQKVLDISPNNESAQVKMLYQQAQICDWLAMEQKISHLDNLGIHHQAVSPFAALTLEDCPKRHQLRSELFVKSKRLTLDLPTNIQPTKRPKRLRIGYFSADFHAHATMYLMAKVFAIHDRECFEIYGYSFGPNTKDEMRQKAPSLFDVFHDVSELSNQDIAKLARQDKIDIAIDLKGHTRDSRLGIFAQRPAPIQISHVGYPGTMGADFIDYLIGDEHVISHDQRASYSENIIYLPNSYQPNDNSRKISKTLPTRQELGLPEQGLVFCCFNSPYKISPAEFNIWMEVLKKVKDSVLWLFSSNAQAEKNLKRHAEQSGINSQRIVFAHLVSQEDHLARYQQADLFLDTFNVNAHTTASDALWAGVPVITKSGKGFAARVSASLLHAVGLPELVTQTEEEYQHLILTLANDPEKRSKIKQTLSVNRLSQPLFDTKRYTKNLEKAYSMVYQDYFEKKPCTDIWVTE